MQLGEMRIPDVGSADLSTEQKLQTVYEYMIQLNRQIRYVLENLGEENLTAELQEKIAEYDSGMKTIKNTVKQDQFATYRKQTSKMLESKASAEMLDALGQTVGTLETTVKQTADGLTAVVTGETAVGRVNTTAVEVNQSGVSVKTGGTFTVDSGNFSLDSDGNLTANGAQINGTLLHEGEVVLTGADIYVGTEEPSSKRAGMVWIRPGTDSDGNQVVQTTHTGSYTGGSRQGLRSYPARITLAGTAASASAANYSYDVTIPIYFGGDVNNATLTVTLGGAVTLSAVVSGKQYNHKDIRLTGSRNLWIANTSTIDCQISASTDNILSERSNSGYAAKLISRAN